MKTLIYILFITCFFNLSVAQNGSINIEQDEKLDTLLKAYKNYNAITTYFIIQVGSGSLAQAQRIKSNVEVDFPTMYSKIDFETPNYKVKLGRFKTKIEAERKLQEVRKKYSGAFLLKPKK